VITGSQDVKSVIIQEFDAADAVQMHLFDLIGEFNRPQLRGLHSFQDTLFDFQRGLISSVDHQTELRFLHPILADADLKTITLNEGGGHTLVVLEPEALESFPPKRFYKKLI
jgi:hypothetical protein